MYTVHVHVYVYYSAIYPVSQEEVDGLGTVEALVESSVVGSREGHHKLSLTLICANHLWTHTERERERERDREGGGDREREVEKWQ